MYTTIYKRDYQQGLTTQQNNYTQSFVITYKGKGSEKKYVHALLNHFAMHLEHNIANQPHLN